MICTQMSMVFYILANLKKNNQQNFNFIGLQLTIKFTNFATSNTKNNMKIFVITLSDKKFDEKYRNFCYKNLTSVTKQFRGDLEDYLDDMDDYLTDKDEKEIEELVSRLTKTSSVGKTMKLKGLGIEFTLRKEELK